PADQHPAARTGPTISVKIHPVTSSGAGRTYSSSLQRSPDEQPPQELHLALRGGPPHPRSGLLLHLEDEHPVVGPFGVGAWWSEMLAPEIGERGAGNGGEGSVGRVIPACRDGAAEPGHVDREDAARRQVRDRDRPVGAAGSRDVVVLAE